MLVVADIGNTTARAGLWRDGIVDRVTVAPTADLDRILEHAQHLGEGAAAGADAADRHIAFCSGVPDAATSLMEWATSRGWSVLTVRGDTETPLVNRYRDPGRLGGDRLAAAVAAVRRFGAPAIVVSLGTATVVDAASAEGEFLGGAVSAGVRTGLVALSEKTRGLPLVEAAGQAEPIGGDTEECLRSGAVYGTASLVEGLAARMREVVGADAPLTLTGGDAALVSGVLRLEHELVPTLTLEGVAAIWEHVGRQVRC
jgi:type III pantothenate kinase